MKRHGSMNHIYRLVWSKVANGWIAVAETTRGRGKGGRRKLVAATLSLTAIAAQAGPTGGQLVSGAGSIKQSGSTTTISQASQNLSLNWASFNIAPQETVNFVQPSASAIAVNRIFDTNGTQILGHLNANGQVYLINPNGILFGAGAQVNVGGLVASTLDFHDASLNGNARAFSGGGTGSVVNQGSITAASGGYVALLGNHVSNQGTISAQQGAVALGAGNAVTLTFSGNSLLQLQVDQSVLNSLAENGGLIRADGGRVIMTAGAKDALLASVVNNTGVIEARTVDNQGGTITLLGGMAAGTVNVGGTLDASAPSGGNGGFIETSAANVKVANDARITTAAALGLAGTWLIDPTDFTIAASGGDQTGAALGTALGLGNVTISSASGAGGTSGNVNVDDTVNWSGHKLTLNASNDVNINAAMTASGTASLDLEPGSGNVNVALGSSGFNGRVNFSGSGVLTMNNHVYTVINSLGTQTSSGDGSLQGARGNLAGYYALGSDINAAATSAWNSGAGFTPIGGNGPSVFSGVFDGLGHTVSGMTINLGSVGGVGMIGALSSTGVVRNVGLLGGSVAVTGSSYIGALVGQDLGKVSNSFSTATVSASANANFIGGLVGETGGTGSITRSHAGGTVNGGASSTSVGGLLGGMQGGTVSNSYASGNVTGTSNNVGGLVGYSYGGSGMTSVITNSYAVGSVSGASYVGGLVGSNYGYSGSSSISKSYATGSVSGKSAVGGLVGHNYGGASYGGSPAIDNSYATGSVTGATGATFVGGLVGHNAGTYGGGTVTNSFSTGSVSAGSGSTSVGGLIGSNSLSSFTGTVTGSFWDKTSSGQATSAAGTGMTTANMQTQANFTSSTAANGNLNPAWNFAGTWVMYSGGYPLLASGMTALTVSANNATSIFNGAAYASNNGVTYTGLNGYRYTGTPVGLLGSISYGGTSQAAVDVGTYTITASGVSSTGQQGYIITFVNGALTINPLALIGTIGAGSSAYGSALVPGTVTFTNMIAGHVVTAAPVTVNTAGLTSGSGNLRAGTHTGIESVSGTLSGADAVKGNYTFAGATGDYTVSPLTLTGTIGTGSSTYGSSLVPGAASFTNAVSGDALGTATVAVNTTGLTSSSGHLTAGTHTGIESVSALSGADAGNYTFAGPTGDYTVSQLALAGSIGIGSSIYGAALTPGAASFTNAVSGDVLGTATVAVNTAGLTSSSGHLIAGTHTGIESLSALSGADAGNYTFAAPTGDYTVTPLALTGAIGAGSSTYGSTLAPGAASLSGAITGDVLGTATVAVNTAGLTSTSGHLIAGTHNGIESVSALSGTDAGNYTFTGITGNYTVNQLALTGTLAAGSSTYGSTLAPGAVSFTNGVTGDLVTPAAVAVNTTGLTSSSGHLIAGTHTGIESVGTALGGADAGNYTFAGATGDYTVNQLALTGTIGTGSSIYGAALTPGAASFTNAVSGDVLGTATVAINTTGLTSSSGHLTAGTHTGIESVSALSGADAGNYTFAAPTGNYTVSPLALNATVGAGSSAYGSALVPGAANFTNAVTGDLVTPGAVTVNTTGLTSSSGHLIAGTHTGIESVGTALGGADAGNYTFAGVSGDYTVSQLALTGTVAPGSSVYGAVLAPGAASFTNAVTGDLVTPGAVTVNTAGLTSSSGHLTAGTHNGIESVGTTLGGADAGNYTFVGATGNYTVSPLALTGTIGTGSSTYGAVLTPGAASFTNAVSGDALGTATVAVNTAGLTSSSGHLIAGTHTGIESVSALSGADAGNYTFAAPTGDYTVNQLALAGSIGAGSSIYGAALTPGAASFTNAVSGDALGTATVAVNTAGLTSSSGHLIAGTHTGIESVSALSGADAGNYTFAAPTGDYTVNQLALTGSIGTGSSIYGVALTPGAASFTNAVSGDALGTATVAVNTAGLTSSSGHLTAGTHTGIESLSALSGADAGNYTFAAPTGDYTVTPLALTGAIGAGSSTYGSTLAPGAASLSGAITGDVLGTATVAVNTAGLTSTSGHLIAGTHNGIESVSALSGTDAGNYTFTGITGNYTVNQLALTGTLAAGSSTYGSTLAPGAVSFTNGVTGDLVTPAAVAVNTTGLTSSSGHLIAGTHTGIESVGTALGGADAGNYTFAGATGDYTVNQLALTGTIGTGSSIYGAALTPGAASFTNAVSGDVLGTATVAINTTGLTSSSGHLTAGTHTGIESVSALSGADAGNYTFAAPTGNYTVSPLALNATVGAGSSAYGSALVPGAANFTNAVTGDLVTPGAVTVNTTGLTSSSGHLIAGTHTGIESVGTALGGADAGNYTFAGVSGDYTVSQLALTGTVAPGSSVYGAVLAPGAASFTNAVTGDLVTPAAVAVNTTGLTSSSGHLTAGTHNGIESVGTALGGADAGNYTFAGTTGNYTVSPLTLTGTIGTGSSTYGSSLVPGAASFTNAVSGDVLGTATVAVNTTGLTSSSGHLTAGTHTGIESVSALSGADAGNYTFAGPTGDYTVSQLALAGSIGIGSSIYGAALTPGAASFTNAVSGDALGTATVAVNTAGLTSSSGHLIAGTHTGIESVSALSGADAGNYTFAAPTGDYTVNQLALTGSIGTGSSIYGAALTPGAASFTNAVSGDALGTATVAVNTAGLTSSSGHLTAGTHTGIESVSALSGADAGNYTFAAPTGDYTVNRQSVTVTASGVNKVYDATTSASAILAGSGLVGGDQVTFTDASASFGNKNAGAGKTVTVSGISASGADAGNYLLSNSSVLTTADITPLAITVVAIGASKTYDGNASSVVTLSGGLVGDALTFSDTSANFADRNVGAGKTVSVSGITASGADAGNYTVNSLATTTANITPATLTYNAAPASSNAGQTPSGLTGSLSGFVANDTLGNATTGALTWTSNVQPTSQPGLYAIDGGGLSAMNYVFLQAAGNATALILKPGAAPLSVQHVITALDAVFAPSRDGINLASLDLVPFNIQTRNINANLIDNGMSGVALKIIGSGVRLPDNIVNTDE